MVSERMNQANVSCCSFCGKRHDEVFKLITGPDVHICDECVELCNEIVKEARAEREEEKNKS